MFRNFIGMQAQPEAVISPPTRFLEVSYGQTGRWFFAVPAASFFLLVHADNTEEWDSLALLDRCSTFNRLNSGKGLHARLLDEQYIASETPLAIEAVGNFRNRSSIHQVVDGRFTCFSAFSPTKCLILSKDREIPGVFYQRLALVGFGMLFFIPLSLLSWRTLVKGAPFTFPIRWRLLALFSFVGGIPLTVITMSGWDFLNQMYSSRASDLFKNGEQALRSFDLGFETMKDRVGKVLTQVALSQGFDPGPVRRRTVKKLARVWESLNKPDLFVIDASGTVVWEVAPPAEGTAPVRRIFASFGKGILADLNPGETGTMVIKGFGESESSTFFAELQHSLGKVGEIQVLGIQRFEWIFTLTEKDGSRRFLLLAHWQRRQFEDLYIRNHLVTAQRGFDGMRLFSACSGDTRLHHPPDFPLFPQLREILERVSREDDNVRTTIRTPAGCFLTTAISPKELRESILVALSDDSGIRSEVRLGRNLWWGFIFLSLCVILVLGFFLSTGFLVPIRHLEEGVRALEARDFHHLIPIDEKDELGALATLLNGTVGSLEDLEVARLVQANLFPKGEIASGGFRVFGASKPMTQLGGDYFDLLPLSDGRILLLIGDVSGHGVPAGLVMAMAKALVVANVRRAAKRTEGLRAAEILDGLQKVIFSLMQVRMMMCCQVGILDPAKRELELANAGHPFPCLVRHGLPPSPLPLPNSMPLVPRRKAGFAEFSLQLREGDRLFFYTDGMAEAKTPSGSPVGYERLFSALPELVSDDPSESFGRIISWHRTLTGNLPQEDDLTILLLAFSRA